MAELLGRMLYFAYGADLRRAAFARRCPGADWLGLAKLEDHRFVIGAHGLASVQAEAGATVWGSLWLVPAVTLAGLDDFAGVASGRSERTTRRVVSPAGPRTEAMLYVAAKPGVGVPEENELAEVLAGAGESRLPAGYIKTLAAWARTPLPAAVIAGKDSR
jgi:gamma-glutamylcyclotransferase (GGCT)/AIG2-like uncharacterized protein YtfP